MEFKVGHSPREALKQIRQRRYTAACQAESREVLAVGVSFSREHKGLAGWEAEQWKG